MVQTRKNSHNTYKNHSKKVNKHKRQRTNSVVDYKHNASINNDLKFTQKFHKNFTLKKALLHLNVFKTEFNKYEIYKNSFDGILNSMEVKKLSHKQFLPNRPIPHQSLSNLFSNNLRINIKKKILNICSKQIKNKIHPYCSL